MSETNAIDSLFYYVDYNSDTYPSTLKTHGGKQDLNLNWVDPTRVRDIIHEWCVSNGIKPSHVTAVDLRGKMLDVCTVAATLYEFKNIRISLSWRNTEHKQLYSGPPLPNVTLIHADPFAGSILESYKDVLDDVFPNAEITYQNRYQFRAIYPDESINWTPSQKIANRICRLNVDPYVFYELLSSHVTYPRLLTISCEHIDENLCSFLFKNVTSLVRLIDIYRAPAPRKFYEYIIGHPSVCVRDSNRTITDKVFHLRNYILPIVRSRLLPGDLKRLVCLYLYSNLSA
jgi:hypothetical protein